MSLCVVYLVRAPRLVFGLHIFLSLNQARKSITVASNAAAMAAGFASGRAGLSWAVPGWCIRMFCAPQMSTLKSLPDLHLALASIALAREFMNLTIFGCCSKTTLGFLSSSDKKGQLSVVSSQLFLSFPGFRMINRQLTTDY